MAQLLKVHGSENQFFVLDQSELNHKLNDQELKTLAINLTNPKRQILNGADGLLVINSPQVKNTLGEMRVFNTDGSEASMCGNGLRTIGRYLADKYNQNDFTVSTIHDVLHQVNRKPELSEGVPAFSVEIAPIHFESQYLPFHNLGTDKIIDRELPEIMEGVNFTSLAVPNPHLIAFDHNDNLNDNALGNIGNKLNQSNPYFPDGVNVSFAKILDNNQLFVRTFERGVGFTNACGTGMAATSLAFALTHADRFDKNQAIDVYNAGGMVKTKINCQNNQPTTINLVGNATFTDTIEVDEDILHQGNVNKDNLMIRSTGEEELYQSFVKRVQNQI